MFDLNLVKFCELFETGSYVDTVIFKNLVYNLQKTHWISIAIQTD